MKLLFKLAISSLFLLALTRLYFVLTDDFRIANITYPILVTNSEQDNKPIPDLFYQPYKYLGKGAQSYVFLSQDGKHVLKFFKFKHIKPSIFDSEKQTRRKKRKLDRLFAGYWLADKYQVPGLTYIHLNTGHQQEPLVTIYDKLGMPRKIHLDQLVFIIQEAGQTFGHELSSSLKKQDLKSAKNLISQIFELYFSEYEQGIYDRDHRVMENVGFSNGKAFHMDVGMLTESSTISQSNFQDMEKIAYTINHWISQNYSQFTQELGKFMERKLSEHYNLTFRFDKTYEEVLKHSH